jgi:hypothetical protein
MTQKCKTWLTGSISALIVCVSAYLPSSAPGCIGTTCGACAGGCFSSLGLSWIVMLYLKKAGMNGKIKKLQHVLMLKRRWLLKKPLINNE